MTEPKVIVTQNGRVTTITLNAPERLNAVDAEMLEMLGDAVQNPGAEARVIVLRGAGRAFSSGADLGVASDLPAAAGAKTIDGANRLVEAIVGSPLPVISVVQGPCVGVGVPIALAADLTVVSTDGYFQLSFARIGLMPDGGASAIVAASVGRATALRMAILGDRIAGDELRAMGLVARVVEADALESTVDEMAATLANGAARAYGHTKDAINQTTLSPILGGALSRERAGQLELLAAHDFAEGARAFMERRAAHFADRP